ncbi:MAG: Asp-tRNA(Asn)/Glu-tRNA(Gln) amidotransferase subunit GatC [Methermicoccaceae archaeon]
MSEEDTVEDTSITPDSLEHVLWLCKMKLDEVQASLMLKELNNVLDYFSILDEVEVEGVKPTYHVVNVESVFREDVVREGLTQEEALSSAPRSEKGFFKAPKMM